jgi:mono/diheme cytochrome c family protein
MWKNLRTNVMWGISCLAIVLIAGMSLAFGASQKAPAKTADSRSVWDGVYTEEQAKRGEPLYYRDCSSCHGDKLQGDDNSPALAGTDFVTDWDGLTLGKLFDKIRLTMPRDGPSQVSNPEKADILAYILSVNKFPAGKAELQQGGSLKEIRFEATKPAKAAGSKSGD